LDDNLDNIRLWQLIDGINQVRPLPRTSATLASVASSYASTALPMTTMVTAVNVTPDRDSSPSPILGVPHPLPKGSPSGAATSSVMTPKSQGPRSSTYATAGAAAAAPLIPTPTTVMAKGSIDQEISVGTPTNMVTSMMPPIGATLKQLASHPACLELLKDALQSERSIENLMFWLDAARFENLASPDERRQQAAAIFLTFIAGDAPHQVNLSASMVTHISRAVTAGVAPRDLFTVARTEIGNLISTNVLPRFLRSSSHDVALQFINQLPLPARPTISPSPLASSIAA
jgi:hypothetical protein